MKFWIDNIYHPRRVIDVILQVILCIPIQEFFIMHLLYAKHLARTIRDKKKSMISSSWGSELDGYSVGPHADSDTRRSPTLPVSQPCWFCFFPLLLMCTGCVLCLALSSFSLSFAQLLGLLGTSYFKLYISLS